MGRSAQGTVQMSDYATSFMVKATPAKVFAAINDARGWWTGDIEGETDRLGGEFSYRNRDLHFSRQRVAELAEDRRIVWRVTDAKLSFVEEQKGWIGADIVFEIAPKGEETELRFTHFGLTPQCECYKACSGGWAYFIDGSLRSLIETGKGAGPLG